MDKCVWHVHLCWRLHLHVPLGLETARGCCGSSAGSKKSACPQRLSNPRGTVHVFRPSVVQHRNSVKISKNANYSFHTGSCERDRQLTRPGLPCVYPRSINHLVSQGRLRSQLSCRSNRNVCHIHCHRICDQPTPSRPQHYHRHLAHGLSSSRSRYQCNLRGTERSGGGVKG